MNIPVNAASRRRPIRLELTLLLAAFPCSLAWGSPFRQQQVAPETTIQGVVERFLALDSSVGELFFAVEVGDEARALELLDAGVDWNVRFGGESLMDIAVRRGRPEVFRKLVESGVPTTLSSGKIVSASDLLLPGQRDPVIDETPPAPDAKPPQELWEYAALGLDADVLRLIEEGADVNEDNLTAQTPLQAAVSSGQISTVRLLLEHGAKVDARGGRYLRTPLELALSTRGNDELIQILRDAGAPLSPTEEDNCGATLLHFASQGGYLHIMRELIEAAASTSAMRYRSPKKEQLLDTPVLAAVKHNETDAVVLLIRRGADLNVQDYRGATPLWCAHGLHDGITARMLITGGADPNKPACDGETPLLEAVRNRKEEKVRVLLEMGADPNANYKGTTGLHHVAQRGTWEMATWLLDAGADSTLRDAAGLTAFELAIKKGNHLVAHVLRPRPTEALILAVAAMDAEALQQALQLGANPTQSLSDGSTPLHQCARKRSDGYETARVLLAAGANPNSLDINGNSPLSELMDAHPYRPFIELLLDAGADPRMGDQNAFMLAQRLGNEEWIRLFSQRPVLPKVPILTRSGYPHPAAQAASACETYAGMGEYAKALEQANWAVHEKPEKALYRLYRAKLRTAAGQAAGAMEDYAILLRDKPSWFDPKVDYGVLLIQNDRFAEGLVLLNEVMLRRVGPPDAKLNLHRGMARAALGDWTGALADLELANQTTPGDGLVLRHLGKVQQALGEMESACQSWKAGASAGDTEASQLVSEFCP